MTAKKAAGAPVRASAYDWRKAPLATWERLVVVGVTGTGKTYWLAHELLPRQPRLLVVGDRKGDYAALVTGSVTLRELRANPKQLAPAKVALSIRSEAHTYEALASEVCQAIDLARAAGDLCLVFEDVGWYGRQYTERDGAEPKRSVAFELAMLACDGRDAASVVFVAQRATQVPPDARSQASRVVSFAQTEVDDLKALEERCGPEFVKAVRGWRSGSPPAIWSRPDLTPAAKE